MKRLIARLLAPQPAVLPIVGWVVGPWPGILDPALAETVLALDPRWPGDLGPDGGAASVVDLVVDLVLGPTVESLGFLPLNLSLSRCGMVVV